MDKWIAQATEVLSGVGPEPVVEPVVEPGPPTDPSAGPDGAGPRRSPEPVPDDPDGARGSVSRGALHDK
ncbi:MAG TPA: hypothetical protein VIC86_03620 [Acidimicrobiales bacterium]